MSKCFHSVFGAFTGFLRAFLFSACIYSCFTLSGLYGVYTRLLCCYHIFRRPVSGAGPLLRGRGLFRRGDHKRGPGLFSCRRSFSAGAVSGAAVGFLAVAGAAAGAACFHDPRRLFWLSPGLFIMFPACFRGRCRAFSIDFSGLFTWPGAAGRINIFPAAGAVKVKKMYIEQIFKCPAWTGPAPRTPTRARVRARPPGPGIFPSRTGKGKQGKFIVYNISLDTTPPPIL